MSSNKCPFKDSPPENPTLLHRAGHGGEAERGVLPVARLMVSDV